MAETGVTDLSPLTEGTNFHAVVRSSFKNTTSSSKVTEKLVINKFNLQEVNTIMSVDAKNLPVFSLINKVNETNSSKLNKISPINDTSLFNESMISSDFNINSAELHNERSVHQRLTNITSIINPNNTLPPSNYLNSNQRTETSLIDESKLTRFQESSAMNRTNIFLDKTTTFSSYETISSDISTSPLYDINTTDKTEGYMDDETNTPEVMTIPWTTEINVNEMTTVVIINETVVNTTPLSDDMFTVEGTEIYLTNETSPSKTTRKPSTK